MIATSPTVNAVALPMATFWRSENCRSQNRSSRSWATAPEAATMSPLTVPSTVAKAMAEIAAKRNVLNERASSGADMFPSIGSTTPLTMAPRPMNNVRM